ncbi:serine/threonine-protein kinase-like protein CCR4 [Quercus lobata]|uniref:serine/threonine-protein kinase-like protein CCR4 n=1 Tax=Quercus lobata TaxID=97700 RepID=UPI0012463714|nr:serine/threonine-protein kinase-like protein CCR4 [Quercus lobata]
MSFFPPARSQSDISENFTMTSTNPSISASPIPYGHTSTNQNSIVSFFSPARSSSVSENHYEIIFPNPSIPTNGPTSLSISLLFPPTMSETETYGSSSESNETQFSYSIMSFFPPARSQSDISDNFTMISTNPSMSASPIHTIEAETFLEYFSLQMLLEATNNFSEDHKIPTSSFGSVYRATLDDGREVAIKRAEIAMFKPCVSKHYSVLKTLSRLSHKNLVPFLGFCGDDNDELVLVYDYMRNGSLHDHLHKLSTPLKSWVARIKVALDVARGIEYLHIYAIPPIIHGDIKLSNILLDATWDAKVTDFGLSLMVPMPAGTVGYMDPECHWLQQLTTKSDVYGFGVLLLQMLSGYNTIHFDINGVPWNVVDFVVPYIVQDKIYRVLDPKVPTPTPVVIDALAYVGYLAVDCVSPDGLNRPSMTEIAKSLQRALDVCLEFFANNSSDTGSWIRNGTTNPNPDFPKQLSFASLFPAYNSDTETDASSESNEIPPKLALYSNFIMSFFLARSQSDSSSSENYEIIPTDPLLSKSPTCII